MEQSLFDFESANCSKPSLRGRIPALTSVIGTGSNSMRNLEQETLQEVAAMATGHRPGGLPLLCGAGEISPVLSARSGAVSRAQPAANEWIQPWIIPAQYQYRNCFVWSGVSSKWFISFHSIPICMYIV